MKKLLLLLMPCLMMAQYDGRVGVNTTQPEATIDINGNARIRQISDGLPSDSILVVNNGFVRKIAVSAIMQGSNNVCPKLDQSSSGYYLLFYYESSIPKPSEPLKIKGLNFMSAGTRISTNTYFYYYSNTTGTPLNLTDFTVDFNGLVCRYKK